MSSASQPSKAQMFFQYGNDAMMKHNYDYAIDMYTRAAKAEPETLIYRQALRGAERRKLGDDPSKVGRLVGAKNQPIRLRARAVKSKGNYLGALEICEEAFVNNPWDVGASRDAAECAEQLGFNLLAQWLLESVQAQATDAEFFRYQAHVQKLNGSWQKAIQCWEQVRKIDPNDEVANREINALSASATIQKAGLGDAIDKSDAKRNAVAAEMEDLKAKIETPEERWLKDIQEDPKKIFAYLRLADSYRVKGQLKEAEELLVRGIKANPGNTDLQFSHSELHISRVQLGIDKCAKRLKEKPDDAAAKAKFDELSRYLTDYEVKEFRRRSDLAPEDANVQLEFGIRLARAGKHEEAIAAFQKAVTGATAKVQAMLNMGLSFEAKGIPKLAERNYRDALKNADPNDKPTFIALNYRLGRVNEALGNTQIAEDFYNEVAALDYTYLDVAKRLQNLG